jgi:hypothetical protein
MEEGHRVNVLIDDATERKLWAYIKAVKTEIGGFGYAKLEDPGTLVWHEVFLVPQTASHSEVNFDGDGITSAVERAANDGLLGNDDFVWVSWHSHHTMKAFWSNTDEKCIETYAKAGIKSLLSFVGCHDRDYKLRLDLFGVNHAGITVPQVTMDNLKLHDEIDDAILADIKANVAEPPKAKPWAFGPKQPKAQPQAATTVMEDEERQYLAAGISLEDAFEIKALIGMGIPAHEAYEMVCCKGEQWVVGPNGLVAPDNNGFDQMAWGD